MNTPQYLKFHRVVCNHTDDSYGSDDLYAKVGIIKYELGVFKSGGSQNYTEDFTLPVGAKVMEIYEHDVIGDDDKLGIIDLGEQMDVERTVRVEQGQASYDITFHVTSTE